MVDSERLLVYFPSPHIHYTHCDEQTQQGRMAENNGAGAFIIRIIINNIYLLITQGVSGTVLYTSPDPVGSPSPLAVLISSWNYLERRSSSALS